MPALFDDLLRSSFRGTHQPELSLALIAVLAISIGSNLALRRRHEAFIERYARP